MRSFLFFSIFPSFYRDVTKRAARRKEYFCYEGRFPIKDLDIA